jgi:DNA-binding Xre family transcriptional regulator
MRTDRGWTLRRMIVEHGFHLAQWQGFEKGKGISVPTLLRLCEIFDLTLEELVGGLGRETEAAPLTEEGGLIKAPAKRSSRAPLRDAPRPPRAPRKA